MLDMQRQQLQQSYEMFQLQQTRDHQLQQLLGQHQQWALSTMLPNVKVPTYCGDPVEYCHFIRSFENLIETKTTSNNTRLYYLVQSTSGDLQELMRSCLSMNPEEEYNTARKLLKQHYGQNYRIAIAYLDRIAKVPKSNLKMVKHFKGSPFCLQIAKILLKRLVISANLRIRTVYKMSSVDYLIP